MKNIDVINSFLNGENAYGSNLYSVDGKLFSYNTCIGQFVSEDLYPYYYLIINETSYSRSTTRWTNALFKEARYFFKILIVKDVPIGEANLYKFLKF